MNSDSKLAWKFLRELTGGAILFFACIVALLQSPYWSRPASLDERLIERTIKLSRGPTPYHTFIGNSLLYRAIDLKRMQDQTGLTHSVLRIKGGRVHDFLFAIEDLLTSDNPPLRIYLNQHTLSDLKGETLKWDDIGWTSFGRIWPQSWNKFTAALRHMDWQTNAFDLIHPSLSELSEFERFMPDFLHDHFSSPIQESTFDTLSFFEPHLENERCLPEDLPLDAISQKPSPLHPWPYDQKHRILLQIDALAKEAGTEIVWVSVPLLDAMNRYEGDLANWLEEQCHAFDWTFFDIAASNNFSHNPVFFQDVPELSRWSNVHLCATGRMAFTEILIRRLDAAGMLKGEKMATTPQRD